VILKPRPGKRPSLAGWKTSTISCVVSSVMLESQCGYSDALQADLNALSTWVSEAVAAYLANAASFADWHELLCLPGCGRSMVT
jgi:hypothetical protein